ncbi:pyridoxal-phosphate dependent enzyme [Ichthyenterobacterium sp. W332]|uniref:Pyridoxal-phosphate dependent enzyme n=1 Tax=Microcosmobacter mediterraneus TaxID=3075607 RepID=A0ABU2YH48_9FLAO|nr:pyridoxal-phosphate dependent enzyme [Ichthyenterobacterium sp. W332]MDT0557499.1 pyridoxal-phosphate dependent enzyme [Ichthyenterobacterium sp. W332]
MKTNLVANCHKAITNYIHHTPVLSSSLINDIVGAELFFKCENFQRAGSYKIRGATNAILNLSEEQKSKGVVTHSSGNFAQALSLAAKSIGIRAYIVMPTSAPQVKMEAVKQYEGDIILCEPTLEAREKTAQDIVDKTGATFIHPSNNTNVIIGQGTAAFELLNKHANLDAIFCPVGGGGLIAGTCLAVNSHQNGCLVYGAEPFEADDAYRSLISGKIETNDTTNTIADGLKTQLGDKNFPIIKEHVSSIIRVTEEDIIEAMQLVWERMKIIIEPSSAVTVAATIKSKLLVKGKKVGIVISGGNVDLAKLPF